MTLPEGSWMVTSWSLTSVSLKRITPASASVALTSIVIDTASNGIVPRAGIAGRGAGARGPSARAIAPDVNKDCSLNMVEISGKVSGERDVLWTMRLRCETEAHYHRMTVAHWREPRRRIGTQRRANRSTGLCRAPAPPAGDRLSPTHAMNPV